METILERVALIGALIYSLVQFLKPVYDHEAHKWNFDAVLALALGISITVAGKVNLLTLAGVYLDSHWVYVGYVLSGIVAGGAVGAGLIHDFPEWVLKVFGRRAVD